MRALFTRGASAYQENQKKCQYIGVVVVVVVVVVLTLLLIKIKRSVNTSGWCHMIHSFRNVCPNLKYSLRWHDFELKKKSLIFNPKTEREHTASVDSPEISGKVTSRADIL